MWASPIITQVLPSPRSELTLFIKVVHLRALLVAAAAGDARQELEVVRKCSNERRGLGQRLHGQLYCDVLNARLRTFIVHLHLLPGLLVGGGSVLCPGQFYDH